MDRPDLTNVNPEVKAYIEFLESQVRLPRPVRRAERVVIEDEAPIRPDEPSLPAEGPTTINILTASRNGFAKRTHRHLYNRQHRGGMGIFDLDVPEDDSPVCLAGVDDSQNLLMFTNRARVFRVNLNRVPDAPIRSKGDFLFDRLSMEADETLAAVLPERSAGYIALVSASGRVRNLRHHLFGEHMKAGTAMYAYNDFGPLAAACWTNGDSDLLLVSRNGIGIRFSEKLIPPQGDMSIRLGAGDQVVAIASVYQDSNVFVIGSDGKGTLRSMEGFAPNKSMGGSGKQLFKSSRTIGMVTASYNDDLFIISQLGENHPLPGR